MMSLVEEVMEAFESCRHQQLGDAEGPVSFLPSQPDELPPGFQAMHSYYEIRLPVLLRRGYHHYAGAVLPRDSDQLTGETAVVMLPMLIKECVSSFCAGVLVGHQDHHMVRMAMHFGVIEMLYQDEDFRTAADDMARGFVDDHQVKSFFIEYTTSALAHLSHLVGFAHQPDAEVHKVWDLWSLFGNSLTSAGYLAGHVLGTSWHERDVLSGIELASEEVDGDRAPE